MLCWTWGLNTPATDTHQPEKVFQSLLCWTWGLNIEVNTGCTHAVCVSILVVLDLGPQHYFEPPPEGRFLVFQSLLCWTWGLNR